MATKQASKSLHSPPSRRHALIRVVSVWWFVLAIGLQSLANLTTQTTHNRLTNNLEHQLYAPTADYTSKQLESSSSQEEKINSTTKSTAGKLGNAVTEQASSRSSSNSNSTFLSVVVQATDIASIPAHFVNHYVVNMNGRQQLGQGEKIIVIGLPKSGTLSITKFFSASKKFRACHHACAIPVDANGYGTYNNRTTGRYMGVCMAEAKEKKLPLIKTCGDYDVLGQMDFPSSKVCHLPQITMLNEIHDEHPDATFILNLRNIDHWSASVNRWRGLDTRLSKCGEMGPKNAKAISLSTWYQEHTKRIRQFVMDHPSHALVEIDVESSNTGSRMAAIFGLDEKFWGLHNANPKRSMANATT